MTGERIIICCKQLFYYTFPVAISRHSVLELEKLDWVEWLTMTEERRIMGEIIVEEYSFI